MKAQYALCLFLAALFASAINAQYVTKVQPFVETFGLISGAGYRYYSIDIPVGTAKMTLDWHDGKTTAASYEGDSVIYLRHGALAHQSASDVSSDDTRITVVNNPKWGKWYIGTRGYSSGSDSNNTYSFTINLDLVCPSGTGVDASASPLTCNQGARNGTLDTVYETMLDSTGTNDPKWQMFCYNLSDHHHDHHPVAGYVFWANVTLGTGSVGLRVYYRNNGFTGTGSSSYDVGIAGTSSYQSISSAGDHPIYLPNPGHGISCVGVYASSTGTVTLRSSLHKYDCPHGVTGMRFNGYQLVDTCTYPVKHIHPAEIVSGVATPNNMTIYGPFHSKFGANYLRVGLNTTAPPSPYTLNVIVRAGAAPTTQPSNYDGSSSTTTTTTASITVPAHDVPYYAAVYHSGSPNNVEYTLSIQNEGSLIKECAGTPVCNGRGECNINNGKCFHCSGRSYGDACELIACEFTCLNGTCNTGTGICDCNAGYSGDDCSQTASAATATFSLVVLFATFLVAFFGY